MRRISLPMTESTMGPATMLTAEATAAADLAERERALLAVGRPRRLSPADAADLAERQRCKAIIQSKEAERRTQLALHLALDTRLPTQDALAILRTAGLEEMAPRPSRLDGHVPSFNVSSYCSDAPTAVEQWGAVVAQINEETKQNSGQ
jgi:hypothetical protein